MKKTFLFISILTIVFSGRVLAQNEELLKMTCEGFYSGKNLVIKNPFCSGYGEIGFSVNTIKINGYLTTTDYISEIVEILLEPFKFNIGDPVKLEVWYKKKCSPMNIPSLMNPGALLSADNLANKKENNIIIEGTYSPFSLLIVNSNNCIKEVKVNGNIMDVKLDKDIVDVNLRNFSAYEGSKVGLKDGDKLRIELKCTKEGQPLLLNPEYLKSN